MLALCSMLFLSYYAWNYAGIVGSGLIGVISVAQCFSAQVGMLSGPGAFLVSTSLSSSWMPALVIEIGGIVG